MKASETVIARYLGVLKSIRIVFLLFFASRSIVLGIIFTKLGISLWVSVFPLILCFVHSDSYVLS